MGMGNIRKATWERACGPSLATLWGGYGQGNSQFRRVKPYFTDPMVERPTPYSCAHFWAIPERPDEDGMVEAVCALCGAHKKQAFIFQKALLPHYRKMRKRSHPSLDRLLD